MSDSIGTELRSSVPDGVGSGHPLRVTPAFGLTLALGFEAYGLDPVNDLDRNGAVRVRVGAPRDVEEWRDGQSEPLFGRTREDGEAIAALHRHPRYGYRLFDESEGTFEISPGLEEMLCAPNPDLECWQWQRFLAAQPLPLLAVLRGLEVLHASAVALEDRVIALVGGSGAGKTSVALHLVAGGGQLFADDVLALELEGDDVIAHPGPGALNLSPEDRERLDGMIADEQIAGADSEGLRVVVERATRPLPLGAVYFLERPDAATRVQFEPLGSGERILGATFNLSILEARRLRRHLDVSAAIARKCGQYLVRVPGSVQAPELAEAIAAHAVTVR